MIKKDPVDNKMKFLKYLSKVHMQYCAILSQQSKHTEALDHAKYGVKYTHMILYETIKIAESLCPNVSYLNPINTKNLDPKETKSNPGTTKKSAGDTSYFADISISLTNSTTDPPPIIETFAQKLLPVLYELRNKIVSEESNTNSNPNFKTHVKASSTNPQPNTNTWRKHRFAQQTQPRQFSSTNSKTLDIRNLLGYCPMADWGSNLNIGSIMQISPLCMQDLTSTYDKEYEISRESLLEKVSLISASYFCASTEKRFLAQDNGGKLGPIGQQSEFWHGKALEIACCFLPPDCPLTQHIFISYQKHHSVIQNCIVFFDVLKNIAGRCWSDR